MSATHNKENAESRPNTPTIKDLEKVFLPYYTKLTDCGMLLNILLEDREVVSDPEWARYALTLYENKNKPLYFSDLLLVLNNVQSL